MTGRAAEYVYAELQVVESCDDPANAEMNGHHVTAIRLNLGEWAPSGVIVLSMRHALQLRNDLDRVLAEHAELTDDDDDG